MWGALQRIAIGDELVPRDKYDELDKELARVRTSDSKFRRQLETLHTLMRLRHWIIEENVSVSDDLLRRLVTHGARQDHYERLLKDITVLNGIVTSPNLSAHLERFMGSIKSECLDRMIFFGENSLRSAVREYIVHYHQERNHQGLENTIIDPGDEVGQITGQVECRDRHLVACCDTTTETLRSRRPTTATNNRFPRYLSARVVKKLGRAKIP